jgi:hypothetical protein
MNQSPLGFILRVFFYTFKPIPRPNKDLNYGSANLLQCTSGDQCAKSDH